LAEVLDTMAAVPAIVVGHDYGAPISVSLTARRAESVSGLVLAAGNLFTDTPIPVPLKVVTWPLIGRPAGHLAFSTPALQMMLSAGIGRPRVLPDRASYLGDAAQRRAIRTIFAGALRELHDRYAEVEVTLPDLRTPTVVLWGDRDPFFGIEQARRAAAALPNASLQVQADAGHFLPTERPEAFVAAVQQLDRATPETAS
jgi:pimeloyl-ACP methyl ester carboxylesterase